MTNKQLKIKSTCMPDRTMDINKWCDKFKVGSRIEKFSQCQMARSMNDQYNFKRMFTKTEDLGFMGRLKSLKLIDLW